MPNLLTNGARLEIPSDILNHAEPQDLLTSLVNALGSAVATILEAEGDIDRLAAYATQVENSITVKYEACVVDSTDTAVVQDEYSIKLDSVFNLGPEVFMEKTTDHYIHLMTDILRQAALHHGYTNPEDCNEYGLVKVVAFVEVYIEAGTDHDNQTLH